MKIRVMGDIREPIRLKRHLSSANTGMENLKDSSVSWRQDFFFFHSTDKHFLKIFLLGKLGQGSDSPVTHHDNKAQLDLV